MISNGARLPQHPPNHLTRFSDLRIGQRGVNQKHQAGFTLEHNL